jgi:hypothetical protein
MKLKNLNRILVHRAEGISVPVGCRQMQGNRLMPSAATGGPETSGVAFEIECGNHDRRGPEPAIVVAPEESMKTAGLIAAAGGEGYSRCLTGVRRPGGDLGR